MTQNLLRSGAAWLARQLTAVASDAVSYSRYAVDGLPLPGVVKMQTYEVLDTEGAMLAVVAGWIGLIALIAAIGYAAMRYRQEIAVIWPQSAGVYSAMGIKLNPQGIDFTKVDYRRENEDGQIVLVVTGNIVNAGSRELSVPQNVRVTLSDDKNHEIYHWNFTPNVQTLKPGQSSPFLSRLSAPPAAARHLEVRFAPHD